MEKQKARKTQIGLLMRAIDKKFSKMFIPKS